MEKAYGQYLSDNEKLISKGIIYFKVKEVLPGENMRTAKIPMFGIALILLLVFSFFTVGGCDVDFGGGGDDNGGGGNGGSSDPEIVQGTITDIIPDEDTEGIMVVITDDSNNTEFTDTTNSAGFFSISSLSSTFAGTPRLEFFDATGMNLLGVINITVFPTARVELGNISLENGTIIFADDTEVTFEGDVITNNCVANSGSLEVEARREGVTTEVIVQVSASTDVLRDGDEILCEEVLIGQEVQVRGDLLQGDSVDADFIDLI